jgi:magnesium-transporting ATPase (P-type)
VVPLAGGAAPLAGGVVPLVGGVVYLICFVLMISIFVITMLYKKPSFIKKKDTEEIDWYVFSPYIALFSIVVGIILYMIYKRVS